MPPSIDRRTFLHRSAGAALTLGAGGGARSLGVAGTERAAPARAATRSGAPLGEECRWIWDGGPEQPVDTYRLFRRAFTLKTPPAKALLRITADREYRLFVNGRYLARGPAPNPPAHASYDEIDIAPHLARGPNAVGVIVYHLGVPSFPRMLGRAGLLAQVDLGEQTVVTDASWRWHAGWWESTGERFSRFREFTEHLDARREPIGWATPAFDDHAWKPAVPLGPVGTAPWTQIEPRDIPLPDHRDRAPQSLLFVGACGKEVPPKGEVAALLAAEPRQPARPGATRDLHTLCDPKDTPAWATIDARAGGVVFGLDFGREVSGFPEIEVEADAEGVVLDLGYGEALEEGGHVSAHRQNNPAADRMTLRSGAQTLRIFHHRAFRYMVVAVRGGNIRLRAPRVVESGYPTPYRGAFGCSDARLTRAWEIGRQTMRLCMDQGFMDCPNRERGQYIGDALAEGPVALYAFGDTLLMRRFLRQAQLCQPADGLLEPAYPCDWTAWHGKRGPHRIPGYGCLWAVMLQDHYKTTGDIALVRELAPTMDRLLAWFEPLRGADGRLTRAPEWNFMDWVKLDERSGLACLNLQYRMALGAAATLGDALGRDAARAEDVKKLAAAFEAAHWDEERGLYRDAPGIYSVHTNALALLALDPAPARAKRVIEAMLRAPDLTQVGSPYFEGFVLRALCRHGRQDEAPRRVRDKWGPQIDAGATTFWEDYAGRWSLCHAWSCEPTALLSRDILGVSYDAVARTVTVAPHPADLAWAQGIVPLPCGDVTVHWESGDPALAMEVSCPPPVSLALDLPAGDGAALTVDGARTDAKAAAGRIRTRLPGGAHTITVG
jgi:hypothetical protein